MLVMISAVYGTDIPSSQHREGIGLRLWGQRLTPTEQKLTPEQQEEVLTLLGAGTSLRRVAKQFDMSREFLRRLVNELKGER